MTTKKTKTPYLKPCPGCGGKPDVMVREHVRITCFKFGCIVVTANELEDAAKLWNAKRFAEHSRD
jgi:hypothetical protein